MKPWERRICSEKERPMSDRDNSTRTGTALVPLQPQEPRSKSYARLRPDARLVTQLLAMRHDVPDYRQRRRSEPGEATSAYRHAAGLAVSISVRRDFVFIVRESKMFSGWRPNCRLSTAFVRNSGPSNREMAMVLLCRIPTKPLSRPSHQLMATETLRFQRMNWLRLQTPRW